MSGCKKYCWELLPLETYLRINIIIIVLPIAPCVFAIFISLKFLFMSCIAECQQIEIPSHSSTPNVESAGHIKTQTSNTTLTGM